MMPGGRGGYNPYATNSNSHAIRQEIQRFESVHPSIYAIYDLIDLVPDPHLAQQIREHVVCIEDSFVNSQEWTLSRTVPDLRLGIVGSLSSGKSALVHRYLTGSYMQEESPEGGRFKKEVVVEGQSYLLLIRDEGGPPELQFTSWVDAIIFVFSLENDSSFSAIYNYYAKMSQFRNIQEIPLILVGTQDGICDNNPRIIEDARARKLAMDLKRCAYYETCATYGLNVERVFQDACQKIVQVKGLGSRPTTPTSFMPRPFTTYMSSPTNGYANAIIQQSHSPAGNNYQPHSPAHILPHQNSFTSNKDIRQTPSSQSTSNVIINPIGVDEYRTRSSLIQDRNSLSQDRLQDRTDRLQDRISLPADRLGLDRMGLERERSGMNSSGSGSGSEGNTKFLIPGDNKENFGRGELPTPSSTPTSVRKNRRRSNLFTPSGKGKVEKVEDKKGSGEKVDKGEVGSGRSIPVRQGVLYKKSNKAFSKDWKKKYVTLCDDGRMTYHPSLHDYMENIHGKEIPLQYVTVKVPGQGPRGMRTVPVMGNGGMSNGIGENGGAGNGKERVTLTGYEMLREGGSGEETVENNGGGRLDGGKENGKQEQTTPNVKKRHRRVKSSNPKGGGEEEETWEFQIVSLDNKNWQFEATSLEERDQWVQAIEQQILNSLQGNEISKSKCNSAPVDTAAMNRIRSDILGNSRCVDCDSPNPDWASLNLGVLVCIECSGIHRNLGSHISRVRSLNLDEWPPGHLAVLTSLGNQLANSIWEHRITHPFRKPNPDTPREEKERYIKAKYERKEFLAPLPPSTHSAAQSLVDAICRSDMVGVSLALAHCREEEVNTVVSSRDTRTPLHLAAALGHLAIAQILIWSNCNVKSIDHEGRSCLSLARSSGAQDVVELLVGAGTPDPPYSGTLPRVRAPPTSRTKEISSSVL